MDKKLVVDGLSQTPYEIRMRGNGSEDTNTALKYLTDEMSKLTYKTIQLADERVFSREQVLKSYEEQKGVCARYVIQKCLSSQKISMEIIESYCTKMGIQPLMRIVMLFTQFVTGGKDNL